MAKRKQTPIEPEVTEGIVERNVEDTAVRTNRITLHLDSDGQIDWEKTKAGTDDQLLNTITNDPVMLEKIASHPDFQDDGSTSPDGTAIPSDGWQPNEAGVMLDLVTKLEGLILARVSSSVLGMKVDESTALAAFNITPEEHAIQDPRGAQVLNEFLKIEDPKWRAVTLLVTAHSASIVRNVREATKLQMMKNGRFSDVVEGTVIEKPNGHAKEQAH